MYESILEPVHIDKEFPKLRRKYLDLRRKIEDKLALEMLGGFHSPGTFTYSVNRTSNAFTAKGAYTSLTSEQVLELYEIMSEAFEVGATPKIYLEADVCYDEVENIVLMVENPTPTTKTLPDSLIKQIGEFNGDLAEVSERPEEFEAELVAKAEARKAAKAENSKKIAIAKASKILEKSGITRQELLDSLKDEKG